MTRNTALRCAAWLAVLVVALPLGDVIFAAALGVQIGTGASTLADVGGSQWATMLYLAGHPQAETYTMLFTIAILIGLAFLVGKIFVALWGYKPPAQAETPALSLAPSLADLEQYRRERDKSRGERR